MNKCALPQIKTAPSSSSAAVPAAAPASLVFRRGWSRSETVVGSAYVELGGSKVVCYAYAPRPASGKTVSFDEGVLECKVSFASHLAADTTDVHDNVQSADSVSALERVLSLSLCDAIKPAVRLSVYPKTVLALAVVVLQSSVMDLAAAVNAASLALVDGAVQVRDLVTAYTLSQSLPTDYEPFSCTVAAMASADDLTLLQTIGTRAPDMLLATIELCKQQCAALRGKMSECIKSTAATQ